MPITISGTTVTFNDLSTQSTNVPNSAAALSAGGIGTYAMCKYPGNAAQREAGFTIAGSSLVFTGDNTATGSGTPTGSWRLMGALTSETSAFPPSPKGPVPPVTTIATTSIWLRYA